MVMLDSISKKFPYHSLSDDILYKKYEIYLKLFNYQAAAKSLDSLVNTYGFDILADDALFHLAELNEKFLNNKTKPCNFIRT